MTINEFVLRLIAEGEEILKDLSLYDREGKPTAIKGYPYELPLSIADVGWEEEERTEESYFPYFLVQISEIKYDDDNVAAKVWILLAITDKHKDMSGWKVITTAMERLINRFQENRILDCYWCDRKMAAAYPDQSDWPHFFAGIEMTWHLPVMVSEMLI